MMMASSKALQSLERQKGEVKKHQKAQKNLVMVERIIFHWLMIYLKDGS